MLNDFTNRSYTGSFDFVNLQDDFLFPEKTNLYVSIGTGKRDARISSDSQLFGQLNLNHIIKLNQKNSLFISSQNYILLSNNYLTNELYRFGGVKSIR